MCARESNEVRKFTGDIVLVAISQIVVAATSIIYLPVIAKSYAVEQYGIWTQVNVTIGILTPLLTLYLGTAVVRYMPCMEDKDERRTDFGTLLFVVFAFCTLFLACSVVFQGSLAAIIFSSDKYAQFAWLTAAWASVETLLAFLMGYFQARSKIRTLVIIQLSLTVLKLGIITIMATQGYSLDIIISYIVALVFTFFLATLLVIIRDTGMFRVKFSRLPKYWYFSVPYIPSGVLFFIMAYADRYIIANKLNLREVGVYAASCSIASIISYISSPLVFILYPQLVRFWAKKETERLRLYLESSLKLFIVLAIPGSIGLSIISQQLLILMAAPQYVTSWLIVLMMTLGMASSGIYYITLCVICLREKTNWMPVVLILPVMMNLLINVIFVPHFGIFAASLALFLSYLLLAIMVSLWSKMLFEYALSPVFILKVVVASVVMAFCLSLINFSGVLYIVVTCMAGIAIFALMALFLRVVTKEDWMMIRDILAGFKLIP